MGLGKSDPIVGPSWHIKVQCLAICEADLTLKMDTPIVGQLFYLAMCEANLTLKMDTILMFFISVSYLHPKQWVPKKKIPCKKCILLNIISTIWSLFYSLLFTVSLFQIINCGEGSNRVARDNKEILQYEGLLIIKKN